MEFRVTGIMRLESLWRRHKQRSTDGRAGGDKDVTDVIRRREIRKGDRLSDRVASLYPRELGEGSIIKCSVTNQLDAMRSVFKGMGVCKELDE